MHQFVSSAWTIKVVKSGWQWWSGFVQMEWYFLLSLFSKQKTFYTNGFHLIFTAIEFKRLSNNKHGIEWQCWCFELSTWDKASGAYQLLFCDGHDSQWMISTLHGQQWSFSFLSSYSNSQCQHVSFSQKKFMASEIQTVVGNGVPRLQKLELLAAFVAVHNNSIYPQSIEERGKSWYLDERVEPGDSIPSPAGNYVQYPLLTCERLHAQNVILQRETDELKAVVGVKKGRLRGKWRFIEGLDAVKIFDSGKGK